MPLVDKLGDLYLTTEDGLIAPRYDCNVESLVPLYPKKDEKVEERQNEILAKLNDILAQSKPSGSSLTSSTEIPIIQEEYLSRDYNEAFQRGLLQIKNLSPNTRREERMEAYSRMAHLGEDFRYTVQTYGRIIISEGKNLKFLENENILKCNYI